MTTQRSRSTVLASAAAPGGPASRPGDRPAGWRSERRIGRARVGMGAPLVLALVAILFVLAASPALAAIRTVNCGAGDDLQAAITAASAGDTLRVRGTCTGHFSVSTSLTLKGVGVAPTLDGGGTLGTTLTIAVGVTVVVERLTITGGDGFDGGGINNLGILTLKGSKVSGNAAGNRGGGINNLGTLTLKESAVSGNRAVDGSGGGILNLGTATLKESAVSGNTARFYGGGILNAGTATLKESAVSGNTAGGTGGGIFNDGGIVTLEESTVSGNTLPNCVGLVC